MARRRGTGRESDHFRLDGTPKRGFSSRAAANKRAEYQAKVWRSGQALHAYPCPVCHMWHVGKPSKRRPQGGGGWK